MSGHDCAAEGHRWGVRRGADALAGQVFWACIECGYVDLLRVSDDDLWRDAEALVRRLTAAIKAMPE